MNWGTVIVIILLIALVAYIITIFFFISKSSSDNYDAFRNIDAVLKNRFAMIPNLEEIVKMYSNTEKTTLVDLERTKGELSQKMTVSDRQKAEDRYSAVFKDVFETVEKYPEIKQSHNTLEFQITIKNSWFYIYAPLKGSEVSMHDQWIDVQFPNGDFLVLRLGGKIEDIEWLHINNLDKVSNVIIVIKWFTNTHNNYMTKFFLNIILY